MSVSSLHVIVHADLDAFYASVEQLDRPELRGRPVLVGGSPEGRGVVAACSYEARGFGVHSAMPMAKAIRMCPGAVIVGPRFDRYRELSAQVMGLLRDVSPVLEQVSIDEAYLDITETAQTAEALDIGRGIKARVMGQAGLTISLGIGPSKSVAKIASAMSKPNGLLLVNQAEAGTFLAPLPVDKLNGIGPRTTERLGLLGIRTLGDLAAKPDDWLARNLGRHGIDLGRMCRGIDNRPLSSGRETKSVSAETTFSQDIDDPAALCDVVARLSRRVGDRLQRAELQGRTVSVKLRLSDFTTFSRSRTLPQPAGAPDLIEDAASRLLELALAHDVPKGARLRLIGVEVSNFATQLQLALPEPP